MATTPLQLFPCRTYRRHRLTGRTTFLSRLGLISRRPQSRNIPTYPPSGQARTSGDPTQNSQTNPRPSGKGKDDQDAHGASGGSRHVVRGPVNRALHEALRDAIHGILTGKRPPCPYPQPSALLGGDAHVSTGLTASTGGAQQGRREALSTAGLRFSVSGAKFMGSRRGESSRALTRDNSPRLA